MPKKKIHRSPLEKLQRAWEKAEPAERLAFTAWLGDRGEAVASSMAHASQQGAQMIPLASGRYLTPETVRRIEATLARRGETFVQLMQKLDLAPTDRSLARALYRKAPLRLAVIDRLQRWLMEHP